MTTQETIKELVKTKYGELAEQSTKDSTGCCGSTCGCSSGTESPMNDDYASAEGYVKEADLGLGCGLPVEHAKIKEGNVVVDLGSGAGNDVFVARSQAGETGRLIGIDFTPQMVEKAKSNAHKLGYSNVDFILGDIENIPLTDNSVDVVISNCVLNLVPDKEKVFIEIFRVLKKGGHFSISDIVINGNLPAALKESAELYVGCVAGAIQKASYLSIIQSIGFINIAIQAEKKINLPESILSQYLTDDEIMNYTEDKSGIYSLTIFGEKS